MQCVVVIPTYNEIDNIGAMIDAVLSQADDIHLLIVDDNSPDGTALYVKKRMENETRIHLVVNEKKGGIGPAYIRGFREAFEYEPKYIIQMDADFSHDPKMIGAFLSNMDSADLIIGSRYSEGRISVIKWPLKRLLLSYFANIYVRFVLGMKIYDTTGGFKCFKTESLKKMRFDKILSTGYSFQIEVNYAFERAGFNVKEIPIIFSERESGESKMSGGIIKEALIRVLRLRFRNYKNYFG